LANSPPSHLDLDLYATLPPAAAAEKAAAEMAAAEMAAAEMAAAEMASAILLQALEPAESHPWLAEGGDGEARLVCGEPPLSLAW